MATSESTSGSPRSPCFVFAYCTLYGSEKPKRNKWDAALHDLVSIYAADYAQPAMREKIVEMFVYAAGQDELRPNIARRAWDEGLTLGAEVDRKLKAA